MKFWTRFLPRVVGFVAKPPDQFTVTILESLESYGELLGQINQRVGALEVAVPAIGKSLESAVTDGAISTVFIGMLLAEIANGDQVRFDELMSQTATFAEARTLHLDGETRTSILRSIDRMVGIADDHFARKK